MKQVTIHVNDLNQSWQEYAQDVQVDIERGGRFIKCSYTISLIAFTFSKNDVFYVPSECQNHGKTNIRNVATLIFGWWGIPWGPIKSYQSLALNFGGGKDVTSEYAKLFKLQTRGQIARAKCIDNIKNNHLDSPVDKSLGNKDSLKRVQRSRVR